MESLFPPATHDRTAGSKLRAIGIDLGTTYSVIAHLDDSGRPRPLLDDSGDTLTPSAVFIDDGEVVVRREDGDLKPLVKLTGHEGNVKCLAWRSDGKQLVSGGSDNSIVIWNVHHRSSQ